MVIDLRQNVLRCTQITYAVNLPYAFRLHWGLMRERRAAPKPTAATVAADQDQSLLPVLLATAPHIQPRAPTTFQAIVTLLHLP